MSNTFTHINQHGEAHMVDVSSKEITLRSATACGRVYCRPDVIDRLKSKDTPKGDVLATARIAGIQAAKRCSDLIPLCHPLPLTKVSIDIQILDNHLYIEALCKTDGKTGVEMEALSAVSICALTVYDMCKALDKSMRIDGVELLHKSGGKSGDYTKQAEGDK